MIADDADEVDDKENYANDGADDLKWDIEAEVCHVDNCEVVLAKKEIGKNEADKD